MTAMRKGEMWVITEDSILMYANYGGLNAFEYAHRLDETKNPKQIDITISRINGPAVGVIKGLYALDGDELRLCLGEKHKDRPAAFPEEPKPGEVLVLGRASSGGMPPTAKDAQPEQKVLTPEEAIKQRPKELVTVKFRVAAVQDESQSPRGGFGVGFMLLKDGGSFSVRLVPPAMYTILRVGIDPAKHFSGKVIRVTGRVQTVLHADTSKGPFWIEVDDLKQFEVVLE